MFSIDYVREIGTQFPLGIDTNHVGDANYLTDGDNLNPLLNTYAGGAGSAITATVAANRPSAVLVPARRRYAGGSSQAAVACYLAACRERASPISRAMGWIRRMRSADRFRARS